MNFWILTTEYPPVSGGGISTYCYHTGQMLVQQGHHVTIFIQDWNLRDTRNKIRKNGITLVRFRPETHHHAYLGDEAALSWSIAEILLSCAREYGAPDFIEAQEYNGIAYFALQKKLLLEDYFSDTIFYITAHAPGFLYLDYNQAPVYNIPVYWTGEMEKSVLKSADAVISPSAFLLNKIDEYLEWPDQIKAVIHNPYLPKHEVIEDYTPYDIVFFGKLIPQKGCMELLEYFKHLWEAGFEHPVRLIGGGDHYFYPKMMDMGDFLRRKYQKYVDQGKLIFEGHLSPELLNSRLADAHVVVVPSIVDNLPYTVLEAMSIGKIVLASNDGGHREIIRDGDCGFIFEHDLDGNSFSHQLHRILALGEQEIKQIGLRARERVISTCGYEAVYKQKMDFLNSVKPDAEKKFPFVKELPQTDLLEDIQSEKGKLSVVIPYYNMGQYVTEAVDSVLKSNYSNIEVILVNDGSTEAESIDLLNSLGSKYPDIRIIHQENQGLAEARNSGASHASGEFLAFLDADDSVSVTYYSKAVRILERYSNVSFVGCWSSYFESSDISWPSFNPEPPYLLVHNMVNSSALVYDRSVFLQFGMNDPNFIYGMEDYDSVINMVKNGCRGVAIPEKLWNYRIRLGSMAQSFNDYSKSYLYRLLSKKHSAFYSRYAEEVVNLLNANGPGYTIENPTRVTRSPVPFASSRMISFIKRNKILRNIAIKFYSRLRK